MALTKVDTSMVESTGAFGRRNILINGDYGIYQRAQQVTGIGASSGYVAADRWHIDRGDSAGRLTATAGTEDAPTESNVTTSLKLACTTADTSIAATEYLILNQKIEGQNVQHVKKGTSGAKQLTASFWVKGNASVTYVVELYDNDNGRHVAKTFAVTSSWSKVELTFPADTTGAFGNDANNSLIMNIWLHAGSNYTSGTLASTWASQAAANRAAGINSFYSSTSNELYITAVQLEVGDVATEFEYITKQEASMLCYRYYYRMEDQSSPMYGTTYNGNSDDRGFVFWSTPVPMNHTPSTTQTVAGGSLSSTYHSVERLSFYLSLTNGDASAGSVDYFDAEAEL